MASDRIIAEIKQRLDIVEYIGRTVDLKVAGHTFKAVCPFHVEKTASFFVFPESNRWHCFGACSEGGDIFSFVQKREGLTFREALELLAQESGVRLESESEAQRHVRAEEQRLLSLCEAAGSHFQQWLRTRPDAEHCRQYVKRRGLSSETIHRFGLGYAPNSWDNLLNVLTKRGYDANDMVRVGLARTRKGRGTQKVASQPSYYDALRDRLIFPIRDLRGRIIGFGGRALHDEQQPKYLNSPQSPLFDKSGVLYGLDLAKDSIRKESRAIIVEGYMDVIAAHQAGFTNVVASLGTALTTGQVRLLARYSPNVTLALDADGAGQKAAERGLETILALQKEVRRVRWERARRGQGKARDVEGDIRVLTLPAGYDPDDLISTAPKEWAQLMADALPIIDYLIARRLDNINLDDPIEKTRVAADLLPIIADLESALVRNHYLQRLARLLQTNERLLAQELVKYSKQARPTQRRERSDSKSRRGENRKTWGSGDSKTRGRPERETTPHGDRDRSVHQPTIRAQKLSSPPEPPWAPPVEMDISTEAEIGLDIYDPFSEAHLGPPPAEPPPPESEWNENEAAYSEEIAWQDAPDIMGPLPPVVQSYDEPSQAPVPVPVPVQAPPSDRQTTETKAGTLGQLEDYLLYLFLSRPAFLPEAINYGLRPDMWPETEHRQIWEALTQHTPATPAHLEEFIEELDAPIAYEVRRIIKQYVSQPAIDSNDWMLEAFNRLDHFLIRYQERQSHQLHYILDELAQTQESNRELLDELGQQLQTVGLQRLQWQQQQLKRINKRNRHV